MEKLPRVGLGFYPTPITEARHLSSILGGPRIFIKREDLCGLALGGSKCRALEFMLAEAKNEGADAVVSAAGSQSNWCLQMAAAACKLGMKPCFVLIKGEHNEAQGNLLLHKILGSEVQILAKTDMQEVFKKGGLLSEKLGSVADDLRVKGYSPSIISCRLSVLCPVGWVRAADEIMTQLTDQNIAADYLVVAHGVGATQAGLVLGSRYLRANYEVIGIAVLDRKDAAVGAVIDQIDATSDFLGLSVKVGAEELEIHDSYMGKGYGITTRQCIDAISLVAQTEGVYLDPVYTGKAMAGLIDLVKKGRFTPNDTIVFIHTGGIPALFAYHKEIVR